MTQVNGQILTLMYGSKNYGKEVKSKKKRSR